jgi:hypothetical protein
MLPALSSQKDYALATPDVEILDYATAHAQ